MINILGRHGTPIEAHFQFSHAGATISVANFSGRPEIAVFFDGGEGGRKPVGPVPDMATAMRIAEVAQAQRALQDGHL